LHAEDFGWPLKKTGKTINVAKNNDKVIPLFNEVELQAAA